MKKHLHLYVFLIIIGSSLTASAQLINVNGNVTVDELIQDNFVDGCVEISNISSSVNGDATGFRSYAEFSRGSSNFPFENGIMLTTGNAESGGNNQTSSILSEGSTAWTNDPDLEAALGINNTLNATAIEFDFISISNQIQFNYLLASEEYFEVNPCNVSDGFAFLIREVGSTDPYTNIAVIPGTNEPVNTSTVHDVDRPTIGCTPQNEEYFAGYNLGDTNYNGRTDVFTASASITPYVQYHIKIVIADGFDNTFDSAVFIEGDSFEILDLGEDIETCSSSVTLDADIDNSASSYEWFLNGSTTPIPGETNPTLTVSQSGTYRVEISTPLGSDICIEEDEITVTIDNQINLDPIDDYELCDDLSGNGIETFDVSTKDSDVGAIIPFSNASFSYHLSDTDAQNNANPITTPIQNSAPVQPIFIRINDTDSGCVAYSTFNLVVNTIPSITAPTNLDICDVDNDPTDGFTAIDLTNKNDEITGGDSNFTVSYHFNPVDANNGDNPIPLPYVNTNTPSETVHARVVNINTGCFNITTLTVDITNGPAVNRDPSPLDGCDTDHDGTDTFDLTQAISDILDGIPQSDVTVTFHESTDDANNGTNPVADPTNYENIVEDQQTIFVRVEDDNTGCATVVPLEIHTNLLLTGTNNIQYALCDDPSNDREIDFNLFVVERYIFTDFLDENGLLPPGYNVTFYESQNDRDTETNPIDKNLVYTVNDRTTLFITIDNSNCSEVDDITLIVNPVLIFSPLEPVQYCDDDDDGSVSIDLASFDDLITGGNADFTVSYFESRSNANRNFNPLPPFYANTQPTETIYARLENIGSGCFTVNPFDIEVVAAPPITQPQPLRICDTDGDGLDIVNLDNQIPNIVSSTTGLNISFHTSEEDANNNTNAITNRTNYQTTTQDIFVRIESTTSNCHAIATLNIIINTFPEIDNIPPFKLCEDDNDQQTDFIFSDWDTEVLQGQTGKEVYYFVDETDALNGNLANAIDKNMAYQNVSSPQTIYIRVENITDPSCFNTGSFTIEVGANPIYNAPVSFLICDDASNDGIGTFNFQEKINEISQGSTTNLDIKFFSTLLDAENNGTPLPLEYNNTQNPEQIYARIENIDSQCVAIEGFGINVVAAPDLSDADPISLCDDNYDGVLEFNLDDAQYEVFDRFQTDTSVHYFENLSDAGDNNLAIPDPNNYLSNSKTVFLKFTNNQTTCYTVIPLVLEVRPLTTINFDGTYPICDNDTNTFDLSTMDDIIVSDPSTVTITYFTNATDAQNNNGALQNNFNYSASSHTFYTRIESLTNQCITYSSFTLQINPNPIANPPNDLFACDDDFDERAFFDLTETRADILGAQPESDFRISFYNTAEDAETGSDALSNVPETSNEQTIYARIENIDTECYSITSFQTIVNPLPIAPLDETVTLCLEDLPGTPLVINANTGNPNDTYLWSTTVNPTVNNSTNPEIQITDSSQIGDYTVTVTTNHPGAPNCTHPTTITVLESQQAINVSHVDVDFADPNTVTVNVNGIGDYVYRLNDGDPQPSNTFRSVPLGPNTIYIDDLNGCATIEENVFIVDIPKFFTPNNDGRFDEWHVIGVNRLDDAAIFIYDRHGKLLKMLTHNSPGWDGMFNGHPMPTADYWFSADITYEGEVFNIRGHFTLKR
ncbi:hypothetical protein MHTCC0001_14480 [Flavobacteriaceae bacterium MHTCC 0001]